MGGTSIAAHEAALRRVEQAGAKLISTVQLFCELQRDWKRSETVPAFMSLFIETGGTPGIQFSYGAANKNDTGGNRKSAGYRLRRQGLLDVLRPVPRHGRRGSAVLSLGVYTDAMMIDELPAFPAGVEKQQDRDERQ